MKFIKRTTLLMLLICLLIYSFITALLTYDSKQTLYDQLSNRMYSDNNIVLVDDKPADWVNEKYDGEYRLYAEIDDYSRIMIQDTSSWAPPMISGYFPKGENTDLKAVVGKSINDTNTTNADGKKWIEYFGQQFEVVGVAGTDYITSCDYLIILFGIKPDPDSLQGARIVLDADNKNTASRIKDEILNKNQSVTVHDGISKGTGRLTKNSFFYKLIIAESILLVTFSLSSFLRYRYEKDKIVRYVYMFHGITPLKIIMRESAEIIAANLISLLISIIVLHLLNLPCLNRILCISVSMTLFSCALIVFFFTANKFLKNKSGS